LKTKATVSEDLFAYDFPYFCQKSRDFSFGHSTHPEIGPCGNVLPLGIWVIQEINVPWNIPRAKDGLPQFSGESLFVPEVTNPIVGKLICTSFCSLAVVTAKDGLPDNIDSRIVV
jgi:hypothetical protein